MAYNIAPIEQGQGSGPGSSLEMLRTTRGDSGQNQKKKMNLRNFSQEGTRRECKGARQERRCGHNIGLNQKSGKLFLSLSLVMSSGCADCSCNSMYPEVRSSERESIAIFWQLILRLVQEVPL